MACAIASLSYSVQGAASLDCRFLLLASDSVPSLFGPGLFRGWFCQASELSSQRHQVREFLLCVISVDERPKDVSRAHGDFGYNAVVRLEREHIFEFVGKFTEFVVATGGRVSFESVHDAA